MAKRKRTEPELPLFDLPLQTTGPEDEPGDLEERPKFQTSLFDKEEPADGSTPAAPKPRAEVPAHRRVRPGDRIRAGSADLLVQLLMLAVAVAATWRLGVRVTVEDWLPFGVLALVFSFLYWVVPLAFWGQTPGMAWVGHVARSSNEEPLTFRQTFLRWIGALLTLGLAGLPLLLALRGRSLSDRLSDSNTTSV